MINHNECINLNSWSTNPAQERNVISDGFGFFLWRVGTHSESIWDHKMLDSLFSFTGGILTDYLETLRREFKKKNSIFSGQILKSI